MLGLRLFCYFAQYESNFARKWERVRAPISYTGKGDFVGFYPITQSSSAPIVCFHAVSRLLFELMVMHLKLDERLSILRAEDRISTWSSLDDERHCIICKRQFNGRQIEIRRLSNRKYELHCPTEGCNSRPHLWIYPTTPLISHVAKSSWWRSAVKKHERRGVLLAPQAGAHRI